MVDLPSNILSEQRVVPSIWDFTQELSGFLDY